MNEIVKVNQILQKLLHRFRLHIPVNRMYIILNNISFPCKAPASSDFAVILIFGKMLKASNILQSFSFNQIIHRNPC